MPRFAILMIFLFAGGGAARAQQMWNFTDGDTPRRPEAGDPGQPVDTTLFPLSPNLIVGRVQWVDTKGELAVILVARAGVHADDALVAREDDCTTRAVLRPIRMEKPSRFVACRVTHGVVRPGLEIVMPGRALLKSATDSLKSHGIIDGSGKKSSASVISIK